MTIPFIRTTKLEPAKIKEFSFDDFSGGLNNRSTPMQLDYNEASEISNMTFITNGGMEKRKGTEIYDDVELEDAIIYMDVYKPINADEVLLRATETEVYAGETKICDVFGQIQGVNYIGNYYFVDGTNYYVYNGTKVYIIKQPPEALLSANANTGASSIVLATWDNRIQAGMDIQIEGINGTEVFEIDTATEATKTIVLTDVTTKDFLAGELVRFYVPLDENYYEGVYKTDETLNLKWYEPCAFELDDDYKGESYIPQNCTCIQFDSERLFVAGDYNLPNEIFISDINNPYYFPAFIGMQCSPNGDTIQDLVQFDNAIIVCREYDIYAIYGETADLNLANIFYMRKLDTHTGVSSINNAKLAHDYMFYLGNDLNVYAMRTPRGDSESLSTTMLNKDKVSLYSPPLNITYLDIESSNCIFYNDEYYINVKDMILVYNYIYRAWTVYNGLNATSFVIKNNELLIGTSDGTIIKFCDEYNDNDVAIECYYKSGQYTFGSPINYKDFLDVYVVTHAYDSYESSLELVNLIDYHEASMDTNIQTLLSRFGVSIFGSSLLSNNISHSDNIPINLRGRTYTFILANDVIDEPMKVYQLSGTYKLRGVR